MRWGDDTDRRGRADAPARKGRDRLMCQGAQFGSPAAAADDERRHAAFLRRQLQPPALREVECSHFTHHGAEAAAAQGFLQRPERIGIAPHLEMQQPVGIESGLRQCAGIKIALATDPQHAAVQIMPQPPTDQPRQGRGGQARFLKIRTLTGKFMEGAEHQATPGEMTVDGAEAPVKRTRGGGIAHAGLRQLLQEGDLTAQGRQAHRLGRGGGQLGRGAGLVHVLFLFSFGGESRHENIKRTFWLTKVFCVM